MDVTTAVMLLKGTLASVSVLHVCCKVYTKGRAISRILKGAPKPIVKLILLTQDVEDGFVLLDTI